MYHWDRDISGRLQRVSTPIEQGCEVSVHSDQMDPLPEEQQIQQGAPINPTAYRSMRDHIHPPRVSAPSCIIPPADDVVVRPYLMPLLPTFHGMENENSYTHIREFEEVCTTFKEGVPDMDLLKLQAFPLTLKDYVAETSKAWDEPNPREAEKMRPSTHQRGGIYALSKDTEMKAKLTTLTRRLEKIEMRNQHEVQAVIELPASHPACFNCQSSSHLGEHCPMVPSVRDLMQEHAHVLGQNKPPKNAPYGNTYNPNWRNHSNLSWKPKPPAYAPPRAQQQFSSTSAQQQQPPPSSPVEQAILNLSKVVGTFVEEQKVLNVQTNQKIEIVESSLNKKIDNMHSEISNKYDNLQSSISRLSNQ